MRKKMLSLLLALLLLVSAAPSAFAAVTDATLSSAVTGTAKYIYTTTPAPQVGSIGGEWAVLGLAEGVILALALLWLVYHLVPGLSQPGGPLSPEAVSKSYVTRFAFQLFPNMFS